MNGLGIERRRAGMTQRIASEKSGIPLSTIRRTPVSMLRTHGRGLSLYRHGLIFAIVGEAA